MTNVLKYEFKRLLSRKEFFIVMVIAFFYISVDFVYHSVKLINAPFFELPSAYQMWILYNKVGGQWGQVFVFFLLPLFAAIPYSDSYLEDKKTGVINFIVTRCDRRLYLFCKGIAVFFSGFIVVFVPLFINQILCLCLLPVYSPSENVFNHPTYNAYQFLSTVQLPKLHSLNPYLHNLFYMLLNSMFAGIIALLSYSISFLKKMNRYLVVILVFLFCLIENVVGKLISSSTTFSIIDYLHIFSFSFEITNYLYFLIFMLVLIFVSLFIIKLEYSKDDV
ncbi:hypothetical protein [Caldicellulosiruptor morganii]|uniref:ABC-2 family transporter protein n=1 Tax=Caldicellulosiruptor morganii TaxID=1387555 RepID=A0ABY7BP83_9FIRM|nr:hypothetical protein [Caldicellulosiruptor morganii]WAM34340.1 hypothetical protein OTK00_000524 [Caldicellulosiruptor morganii]